MALPLPMTSRVPRLGTNFHKFVLTGSIGFIIDATVFTGLLYRAHQPHLARLAAFGAAVTVTYLLNKHFTFNNRKNSRPALYFFSQAGGVAINMAVFSLMIAYPLWLPAQYYLGLAMGSLTAMTFNYHMSQRYVFV